MVQYPMQFSGPPRSICNVFALCRRMVVQLTQLELHFIHYYYPLNIAKLCLEYHIYFMVEYIVRNVSSVLVIVGCREQMNVLTVSFMMRSC